MCGRYFLADKERPQEIRELIAILQRTYGDIAVKTGEILPTDIAPVIANGKDMVPRPFLMKWGYAMRDGKTLINARVETASQKPMFADGMKQRRCLIPASHYFEWERRGKERIRYAIAPKDCESFMMAGLYRIAGDHAEYTVLTRDALPEIAFIHDRMPLIIPGNMRDDWLDPHNGSEELVSAIGGCSMRFGCA